jgi:hypothetical protein
MSTQPPRAALDARRVREARIRALRLRIAGIAVAIFLAAWVVIFVQLTTGHDPALAQDLRPVVTQSADPQADNGSSSDAATGQASASGDAANAAAAGQQLAGPADVTTSQS